MNDEFWMKRALWLAKRALISNKMPIASILVYNNTEISHSFNYANFFYCPYYHSEIISFKQGSFYMSNFLLNAVNLYVTLEPCQLCLSFSLLFRIKKIIFAAYSKNLKYKKNFTNIFYTKGGVLQNESLFLLKKFYSKGRMNI